MTQQKLSDKAGVSLTALVRAENSAACTLRRATSMRLFEALHAAIALTPEEQRAFMEGSGLQAIADATRGLVESLKRAGEREMSLDLDDAAHAVSEAIGEEATLRVFRALATIRQPHDAPKAHTPDLIHHSETTMVKGVDGKTYAVRVLSPQPSPKAHPIEAKAKPRAKGTA